MKKLLAVLALLVAALAGVAYWINRSHGTPAGDAAFTTAAVEFGPLTESISASAVLRPQEVVLVTSDLPGKVVEIYPAADFNQVVQEGDPLLRLDDRAARRKLEQARVGVRLAKANLTGAEAARAAAQVGVTWQRRLLDKKLGPEAELDKAEAQLKTAEAAVEAARVRIEEAEEGERQAQLGLDLTVVRVLTLSGPALPKRRFTILERKVEIGQQVGPQSPAPLCTLARDLSRLRLHVRVAEADVSKVRVGQQAEFTVPAYSDDDTVFKGEVTEVRLLPAGVHGAVFYETVIEVANERDPATDDWRLRPGMTASVDIVRRKRAGAWKVPAAALSFHPEDPHLTDAARAKLVDWQGRTDWQPVWVSGADRKPWPVFVRTGGTNARGEAGLRDAQSREIHEWDPELQPVPDARAPATHPRVIIGAPPAKGGLFGGSAIKF